MSYSIEKKQAAPGRVLRVYWEELRKYPGSLFIVLATALTLQAANIAAPLFMRQFFNTLAQRSGPDSVHELFFLLILIASMWFSDWLSRRVQDFTNMGMSAGIMTALYAKGFGYLIEHSYSFFISNFTGSLTHRITKFVRAFETLFDSFLLQFLPTFLFVSGAVVIIFLRSHLLGIVFALWTAAFLVFQVWVSRSRQAYREARSNAETRATGALADAISNHSTISLFSGLSYERGLFAGVVDTWQRATLRSWYADSWTWAGMGLFFMVIEAGLFAGGILLWEKGLFTLGDFVLIQAYLIGTFDHLVSLNRELRRFYDALADAGEMVYILDLPHEIQDAPRAKKLKVAEGKIDLRNVEFFFNPAHPVLEKLNLSIRGGEKVAFVGPSGAGKSTITRLLLRFYDVKGGSIEIDGQDIAKVKQESLRDHIAYVPQEPILFHRTLRENIRYGRRGATDEEIIEAAKKAHCHEFIAALPDGYDTYVGERGVKLSGGERQRVAIARAILKNAPILLLDEATSSLDSESEALIQDALQTLMQGKTVIVIAHRLSTIMNMDRIIVIDGGTIVAEGTHEELLEHRGLYHKLWSIQAGGFIQDEKFAEADMQE